MSKEILKGIFEENIAPVREDITFEGWVDKIKDNEEYKVGLFENYVQPSMPDATFEDFNAETFGLGKVEAPLGGAQSEESVSPTESVSSEFEVGPPGVEPKGAPVEEAAALVGEVEPTMMGQKLDPYTIVEEDDRNFFERLFGEERYRRVTERAVETVPALTRLFGKAAAKDVQEEVSDLGRAMDFDPEFVVKASQSGLFTTNNLATYLSQEAAGDKKGAEEINMFLEKGAEGKTTQFQRFKTLYAPIEKERNEAIQKELLSNRDYVALRGKIDAEFNRQRVGVDEKYDFKALMGEEFKVGEKELLDKYESATLALPMQLESKANELKFEYQAKVNSGQISVDEANAGLRRDLDAYGAELQKQSDKALEEYNSGVTALAERLEKGVKDKPEFKAYMDELNELRNGVVESFSDDYQKIQQSVFNNVAPKYNSKIETAITNSMRGETPLLDKSGVKGDIAKIVNNRGWDYLAFDQKRAALDTMFGTALSKLKRSGVEINDGVVANLRAEFDDAFMDRAYFTKKGTPSLFMVKTRAIEEAERLDEMLKEREAKTGTKTYTSGIYGSEFGVGGKGYDDTDVQELRLAREKLQEIIDMPETMSDSEWSNFWNGLTSGQFIDYLPFVSGLKNLSGTLALYRAVGKDTESARYLKNAEALNSTYRNMYEVNNIASDWYKAGKGTAQSLPFMMEFAATAGVGSGVRLGTEKVVVKLLGKQAETVVGKSLKVMAGTLISSLAQTTLNPQRYVDETLKRMTPQMTMAFSPEGDDLVAMLDSSDVEGGFEAALKGFGVTASEYFSEGLGFAGARAMKAVGSKMLQNEFLKRAYIGWYMSKFNFDTPTAFKKIAEMGGWNGFLMEFGVEELTNIPLTNLITGDAKVMEGIIKDGELDTENLADIVRTLLPISLAGGAFSLGTLAISKMSPEGVTITYRDINNLPATETINKGAWDAVTEVMKSPAKVRDFIANELPKLKVEGKGREIVTSMLERAAIEFDRGVVGAGTRQIAEATSPLEVTFEPIPETAEAPKVEIIAKRRQKLNRDRTKLVPTGGFDYFAKVGDKEIKLSDAEYKAYKESGVLPESVSAVEVAPEVEGEAVAPEAVAPEVEALRDVESTAKALEGVENIKDVFSKVKTFAIKGLKDFFHASPQKRIGRLRKGLAQQFGAGVYFSTNKDLVTNEFGENVTNVSLVLSNPVFTNTPEWTEVEKRAIKMADDAYGKKNNLTLEEDESYFRYDPEDTSEIYEIPANFISEAANEMGYDAIVDEGSTTYENEISVLDDSKIVYEEDIPSYLSEAYHKAKEDGSNPELVSAVEELLGKPAQAPEAAEGQTAEGQPAEVVSPEVAEVLSTEDATRIALESLEVLPEGIESAEEGARIYHEAIGKEERTEAEDAIVMAVEDAVIGGAVATEETPIDYEVASSNVEETTKALGTKSAEKLNSIKEKISQAETRKFEDDERKQATTRTDRGVQEVQPTGGRQGARDVSGQDRALDIVTTEEEFKRNSPNNGEQRALRRNGKPVIGILYTGHVVPFDKFSRSFRGTGIGNQGGGVFFTLSFDSANKLAKNKAKKGAYSASQSGYAFQTEGAAPYVSEVKISGDNFVFFEEAIPTDVVKQVGVINGVNPANYEKWGEFYLDLYRSFLTEEEIKNGSITDAQTKASDALSEKGITGHVDSFGEVVVYSEKDIVKTRQARIYESNAELISDQYHKAKADGSNPELVKAVDELLGKPAEAGEPAEAPKAAEGKEPSDAQMETKIEEVSTITQIRPKNLRDLYKVNRELFGQNKIKALASAIAMDRMVGAMAKRSGITKAEMYGRLKFEKASEEFMKGLSADGKILYQIIGQNANLSETVRENLQVARDMEAAGKDAKTIRLATGWEKGKDGKWRYEIGDGELNISKSGNFKLGEIYKGELLEVYPFLKEVPVRIDLERGRNFFFFGEGTTIARPSKDGYLFKVEVEGGNKRKIHSILEHELNHIVQIHEGFARGGSYRDFGSKKSFFGQTFDFKAYVKYRKIAGEVEARNVQTRMGMTPEQRRGTLLSETEDVARDEQIVLFQKADSQARGAVMVTLDGQAVVYALTDPNVSTPLHEMAHIFEHYLTPSERNAVIRNAGTNGWTTETSEYFARGFERYLAEGSSPIAELNKVFAKFREWLVEIYNGIVGSDIDIELNPEMRKLYDTIFGETAETPKPAEGLTSKEKAEQANKRAEEIAKEIRKNLRGRGGITGITPFSRAKRLAEVDRATLKLIKDYIYQKVLAGAYTFKDFVKDMKENSKRLFGVQINVADSDKSIFHSARSRFEIDDAFAQEILDLKQDFIFAIAAIPGRMNMNFQEFISSNSALVNGFVNRAESIYGLDDQAMMLVQEMYQDALRAAASRAESYTTLEDVKKFHETKEELLALERDMERARINEEIKRRRNWLSRNFDKFKRAFITPVKNFNRAFEYRGGKLSDYRTSQERDVYSARKYRMGASTKANNWYNAIHKKIYGDLSWFEKVELDKYLIYRRIVEVTEIRNQRAADYKKLKDELAASVDPVRKQEIKEAMAELEKVGMDEVKSGSIMVDGKKEEYTVDLAKAFVSDINARNDALAIKIKERAEMYTEANNELLKMRLDAGLISQEAYDSMEKRDYVRRLFVDLSNTTIDEANYSPVSKEIKAIKKGREDAILEMDSQALLQINAQITFDSVAKNKFVQKVVGWAETKQQQYLDKALEKFKDAHARAERYLRSSPRPLTQDEIDRFIKEQTLFIPLSDDAKVPSGFTAQKYFVDGVEKRVAVRDDIANVFQTPSGRGVKENSFAIKALSAILLTPVIKASAVFVNPAFAIGNFALDVIHASMVTRDLYKSFTFNLGAILAKATGYTAENVYRKAVKFGASLFGRTARDSKFERLVKDYFEHGGGMSGLANPSSRMYSDKLSSSALRRGFGDAKDGIIAVLDVINSLQAGSELITRVIVYEAALEKNIAAYREKNGVDPVGEDLALMKMSAAASAADLIDFREGAEATKVLDQTLLPFLNAMIQGAKAEIDFASKNPLLAAARLAEFGGMALGVALYNANSGDEDEKENIVGYNGISEYIKSNYFIMMMPWTKKNERGEIVRPFISIKLPAALKATNIMITGMVADQGAENTIGQMVSALEGGYVPEIGAVSPTAQIFMALRTNKDAFRKGAPIYRGRPDVLLTERFNAGETKAIYRDLFGAMYDLINEDGENEGVLGFDEAGPAQWQAAFEKAISPNNPYYLGITSTYAAISSLYGKENKREVDVLMDEKFAALNAFRSRVYREPNSSVQQKNIEDRKKIDFLRDQKGSWQKKNDDAIEFAAKTIRDFNNLDRDSRNFQIDLFFDREVFGYISDDQMIKSAKAQGIKDIPENVDELQKIINKEQTRLSVRLVEEFKPRFIFKHPALKNYAQSEDAYFGLNAEMINKIAREYDGARDRKAYLLALKFVAGDDFDSIVKQIGAHEKELSVVNGITTTKSAIKYKKSYLRADSRSSKPVSSESALNNLILLRYLLQNE